MGDVRDSRCSKACQAGQAAHGCSQVQPEGRSASRTRKEPGRWWPTSLTCRRREFAPRY